MKIGIDVGNSDTKTQNTTTPSGYTIQETRPLLAKEYLFYNGHYYIESDERFGYVKDKTEDDECLILTLFGIAKEIIFSVKEKMTAEGHKTNSAAEVQRRIDAITGISIGVGLPVGHFDHGTDSLKAYYCKKFGDSICFEFSGFHFTLTLNSCTVFPQDLLAVIKNNESHIVNDTIVSPNGSIEKLHTKYYIIGIGGGTTDIIPMIKGVPDAAHCKSLEFGSTQLYDLIKNNVNRETGDDIDIVNIEDILIRNITTMISDETLEVVRATSLEYASAIISACISKGLVNFTKHPAVFIGGGSCLLENQIREVNVIKNVISTSKTVAVEFFSDVNGNARTFAKYVKE